MQKIITTQKGLALDFDGVGRDAHAHSKELYTWGQAENEDLKDGESSSDLQFPFIQRNSLTLSERSSGLDGLH